MKKTALVITGYQNDIFHYNGKINPFIKDVAYQQEALECTFSLLMTHILNFDYVLSIPFIYNDEIRKVDNPLGLFKWVADTKAFEKGSYGAEELDFLSTFGELIHSIPCGFGLNIFSNPEVERVLKRNKIEQLFFIGACSALTIDSSGQEANLKGYQVTIFSDCFSATSLIEKNHYCEKLFPKFSDVTDSLTYFNSRS
ncbi:isochorismatase family protein [Pseudoalteromonas sp. BZK2]|uniref:isochorismatase family protein n=1 Tax=Pseudoalteromonas sp. BZK2 TaxID=1904458 RepID=UPI00165452C6|nr:isochorismatase family protein [Pseudoalteromonas sp. BZK2]MBC7010145.1 isochorismatase family protein [Pseudoalteromonas sp. BZK2]